MSALGRTRPLRSSTSIALCGELVVSRTRTNMPASGTMLLLGISACQREVPEFGSIWSGGDLTCALCGKLSSSARPKVTGMRAAQSRSALAAGLLDCRPAEPQERALGHVERNAKRIARYNPSREFLVIAHLADARSGHGDDRRDVRWRITRKRCLFFRRHFHPLAANGHLPLGLARVPTTRLHRLPSGPCNRLAAWSVVYWLVRRPSTAMIRLPARTPACSAGLPPITRTITSPPPWAFDSMPSPTELPSDGLTAPGTFSCLTPGTFSALGGQKGF